MHIRKQNAPIPSMKALIAAAAVGAFAVTPRITMADDQPAHAALQDTTSTGSRIIDKNRGPLTPVRVIERAEIDASGDVSIAELLRDSDLAVFGNRRPFSNSRKQPVSEIDLLGLGSSRTLVLLDGRPVMNSSFGDSSANLNLIPIGAIERIEILPEGASAIHGSSAIGGVVNFITRKRFDGVETSYTVGRPSARGGDVEQGNATFGSVGERGSVTAGVSYHQRGAVKSPSVSADGQNDIAPFEVPTDTSALFTAASFRINEAWTSTLRALVSRNESFGRAGASASFFSVPDGSPNDPQPGNGQEGFLFHRFDAVGPRESATDENLVDLGIGVEGRLSETVRLQVDARMSDNQGYRLGRNFIVRDLASRAIAQGTYSTSNPFGNVASVIDSIRATTSRDARRMTREASAVISFDALELAGGRSAVAIGAEWRDEFYQDRFDSLQSSNAVIDAAREAANRSATRINRAVHAEWFLPIAEHVDISAAGRLDHHSNLGSEFSPKISARWQPMPRLAVHGSWGESFVVPSLPSSTGDRFLCEFLPLELCPGGFVRILESEHSRDMSLGATYTVGERFDIGAGYHRVRVDGRIPERLDGEPAVLIPLGVSWPRDPVTGDPIVSTVVGQNHDSIDVVLRSRVDLGSAGHVTSSFRATHVRALSFDWHSRGIVPVQGNLAGDFGMPDVRANMSHDWTFGDFGVHWQSQFIAGTKAGDYLPAVGGHTTHDVQLNWNTPWNGRLAIGATNLGNKQPTLVPELANFGDGHPWNFDLYDHYGRMPYLRYTQSF